MAIFGPHLLGQVISGIWLNICFVLVFNYCILSQVYSVTSGHETICKNFEGIKIYNLLLNLLSKWVTSFLGRNLDCIGDALWNDLSLPYCGQLTCFARLLCQVWNSFCKGPFNQRGNMEHKYNAGECIAYLNDSISFRKDVICGGKGFLAVLINPLQCKVF